MRARQEAPSVSVLILAAGMGRRMRSSLPKVLHPIGGQPILFHLLDRVAEALPGRRVGIVVGHGRDRVEAEVGAEAGRWRLEISFIHQPDPKGTGDAARCAVGSEWGEGAVRGGGSVLVLPGDLPLLTASLIERMSAPLPRTSPMRLLTCDLPDPAGYGRVLRRGRSGPVLRIVEERDASDRQRSLREVAASIYLFDGAFLARGVRTLSSRNAQGEYYLTDLVARAGRGKGRVDVLEWREPLDLRGVNDPWELALAGKIFNERIIRDWARRGARFVDPGSVWIDCRVELAEEVVVHPGAILRGRTRIGHGTVIGPYVSLLNMEVGSAAHLKAGCVAEDSRIGDRAQVGPYAHLRPGSSVGAGAKIGNFVELKKASVGEDTSVAHLSYLGDAEVGRRVNIGCGFITCNFDGRIIDGQRKHRTVIEDDVFVGSDCQALAPVRIGSGAYVASGSTIQRDVEPEALAIARSRQVNKPGYARKLRDPAGSAHDGEAARPSTVEK